MNLAVIPARAGSKGLKNKNIFPLNGKPLFLYTLEAALAADCVDSVVVSTDIANVKDMLKNYPKALLHERDKSLCDDNATLSPAIISAVKFIENQHWAKIDTVFTLQPTSPLRTKDHIEQAYRLFTALKCQSLISVKEEVHSIWKLSQGYGVPIRKITTNRQLVEPYYTANGAIFITDKDSLFWSQDRICGDVALYPMNDIDSLDIHTKEDIELAEYYLKRDVI